MLEEQHAACPPVKASPSIAVGAPGTVFQKTAKKPPPPRVAQVIAKIPEAVPIAVPIVEAPKVIPTVEPPKEEPVAKPVELEVVAAPEPEPEVEVHEVEIPEVPAPVITEEPVIETPPVEAAPVEEVPVEAAPVEEVSVEEAPVEVAPLEVVSVEVEAVEEEEPIISEAEPEIEVTLPAEAPVATPAEIEVVPEETPVVTETEEADDVCEQVPTALTQEAAVEELLTEETQVCIVETVVIDDSEIEATEPEVEQSIEPEQVEEAVPVAVVTAEAETEDVASQSEDESVDSGPVEVAADEPESVDLESVALEQVEEVTVAVTQEVVVTESAERLESEPAAYEEEEEEEETFSSQEEEEEECEMEVLPEETSGETNHITEDIIVPNEDLPEEEDSLPLPPLTAAPEPVTQIVDSDDVIVDDFVVTDTCAEVIEPKTIELLPVFEKPTVAVCEIFGQGKMTSETELITATENTFNDVAADEGFDVEEPLPETCPIPIDQETVTNASINMLIGTEWMAQQQVPGVDC